MLSVSQSARELGISPARVRALIKSGKLPAVKNGREWVLQEEDILQRLAERPRAGRPSSDRNSMEEEVATRAARSSINSEARAAYDTCRKLFAHMPTAEMMAQARTREEASFYMAATDFFMQQKQMQLVAQGVF